MFFVFRDSYVLCIYVTNILCAFPISVSWICYKVTDSSSSVLSITQKEWARIINNFACCIQEFLERSTGHLENVTKGSSWYFWFGLETKWLQIRKYFFFPINKNFITLLFVVLDLCSIILLKKLGKMLYMYVFDTHTHTHTHTHIYIYIYIYIYISKAHKKEHTHYVKNLVLSHFPHIVHSLTIGVNCLVFMHVNLCCVNRCPSESFSLHTIICCCFFYLRLFGNNP